MFFLNFVLIYPMNMGEIEIPILYEYVTEQRVKISLKKLSGSGFKANFYLYGFQFSD